MTPFGIKLNTIRLVISRRSFRSYDNIAIDVEFPPHIVQGIPGLNSIPEGHDSVLVPGRRGSRFVIVVHHIDIHAFASITTAALPIVDHVISDIDSIRERVGGRLLSKPRVSAVVMSKQVMMKRSVLAAPDAAIAVFATFMN